VEDAAIVALYWQRDSRAITETDGKYGPFCRRVAQNILTLPEDAEECVNDAWHRAWNTMPPKRPDSLRAYLARIVRNLSLDRWRREHTQKRGNGMELLLSELEECVPTARSTEEIVEAAELSQSIDRWLKGLPQSDSALFVRRYWNGELVSELAREAGAPENRLRQKLFRLRHSLRKALEKEGVNL